MQIEKEELCELIPHSGSMCLLDSVISWNEKEIYCLAVSHTDQCNPLRRSGRLISVHLLEYGAQAMAVHGGLLARESNRKILPGYLASLRDVLLHQEFIDNLKIPLMVHAKIIASLTDSFMYEFTITAEEKPLANARATVIAQKKVAQ